MPKPRKRESKDEFISRCVEVVMHEGTTSDPKQAVAICYSIWDEHKKKIMGRYFRRLIKGKKKK